MKGMGKTMTTDSCSMKRARRRSAGPVCIATQRGRNCLPVNTRPSHPRSADTAHRNRGASKGRRAAACEGEGKAQAGGGAPRALLLAAAAKMCS